jgi:glycosyltransferase involved in cell wall biosynthesis
MKILQLIFSLDSGGAERLVTNLSNELMKNNEVIVCIVFPISQNPLFLSHLSHNIKIVSLNQSKGISLIGAINMMKIIRQERPQIIHAHLNTVIYCYLPSLFLRRVKYFHTLHNLAEKTVANYWQKKVNYFFYKTKKIIPIGISELCATSFIKYYKIDKIDVVENGVPSNNKCTSSFQTVKFEMDAIRNNDLLFLHIASYSEAKNQKMLIDTFNELILEGYPIKLIVIGKGFTTEVQKKLNENNQEGILFLGEREFPTEYLLSCDCFVMSSLWEGLPMSLLEALSCGIPAVSTPAGGIVDVLENKTFGLLSEDFSLVNFKKAVVQMIFNLNQKYYNKQLIQAQFELNYSIERTSEKYLEIFRK